MANRNLIYLHEAIVIALINLDNRKFTATFEDIAEYIDKRKMFSIRKGNIPLSKQVMLRATKSKGAYKYLFQQVADDIIRLKLTSKHKVGKP